MIVDSDNCESARFVTTSDSSVCSSFGTIHYLNIFCLLVNLEETTISKAHMLLATKIEAVDLATRDRL